MITWHTEKRKLSDLIEWGRNPRQLSKHDAEHIKRSLEKFGVADPLVINTDNLIIGGHQRKRILQMIASADPDYQVDVRVPDRQLTDEEVAELNIRLNKNSGSWDWDVLANEFEAMELIDWGFTEEELMGLDFGDDEPEDDPGAQVDKAEELREKWGVESGQLWQLGEHRLICGDCTDKTVVDRLMVGEKAALCFTSPPYGELREYELGEFDYMQLYKKFSELAFENSNQTIVNLGLLHRDGSVLRYWEEWLDYCESIGNKLFGWYVWDQLSGMPGDYHGRLARSHEWVFHFSNNHKSANKWIETTGESLKRGVNGKRFRQKDGKLKELGSPKTVGQPFKVPDSVIRIRREMARGIHTETHPAVFSVEFVEFGINTWSVEYEIIYEPFCGSGTTIIACENLNRKCRAIEISPAYCAVAIERWHEMTGKEPELLDG